MSFQQIINKIIPLITYSNQSSLIIDNTTKEIKSQVSNIIKIKQILNKPNINTLPFIDVQLALIKRSTTSIHRIMPKFQQHQNHQLEQEYFNSIQTNNIMTDRGIELIFKILLYILILDLEFKNKINTENKSPIIDYIYQQKFINIIYGCDLLSFISQEFQSLANFVYQKVIS